MFAIALLISTISIFIGYRGDSSVSIFICCALASNFNLSKYKVFDDSKNHINKIEEPEIEYPVTKYDGVNLPFENETFDIIYSSNVLTHVQDLKLLLEDMKRVLKKKGAIVGLADGILYADNKAIYEAENLKVGLFKSWKE